MNPVTQKIIFNVHQASLLLSAGSVLAGLAASTLRGDVSLFPAIMTLLCAMLFQTSSNLYYGYRKIHAIKKSGDRAVSSRYTDGYFIMKTLSNVLAILAFTMALPLFTRLGWLSIIYIAAIGFLVYFHFGGRRPLVKTKWSVIVTFLLFGPIAVSGTALVQDHTVPVGLPIIGYSIVSGLLAVNAHLSIQFLRRIDDMNDGMTSLLLTKGVNVARWLYGINILIVSAFMIAKPDFFGFASYWYGCLLALWLIGSSVFVLAWMGKEGEASALKIRMLVIIQYVSAMAALLCMVLHSVGSVDISLLAVQ